MCFGKEVAETMLTTPQLMMMLLSGLCAKAVMYTVYVLCVCLSVRVCHCALVWTLPLYGVEASKISCVQGQI